MRMTLDFTDARMSACHAYVGVRARIDDGPDTTVTIGADGSGIWTPPGTTLPCERPEIDKTQAWSVAVLLTGDEAQEPGTGAWDERRLAITYPLGRKRRTIMT